MKPKRPTFEEILDDIRFNEGLSEEEALKRAAFWDQELTRMDIRSNNQDRNFYRTHIPVGLRNREDSYKIAELKKQERLRLKDWGDRDTQRDKAGTIEQPQGDSTEWTGEPTAQADALESIDPGQL